MPQGSVLFNTCIWNLTWKCRLSYPQMTWSWAGWMADMYVKRQTQVAEKSGRLRLARQSLMHIYVKLLLSKITETGTACDMFNFTVFTCKGPGNISSHTIRNRQRQGLPKARNLWLYSWKYSVEIKKEPCFTVSVMYIPYLEICVLKQWINYKRILNKVLIAKVNHGILGSENTLVEEMKMLSLGKTKSL